MQLGEAIESLPARVNCLRRVGEYEYPSPISDHARTLKFCPVFSRSSGPSQQLSIQECAAMHAGKIMVHITHQPRPSWLSCSSPKGSNTICRRVIRRCSVMRTFSFLPIVDSCEVAKSPHAPYITPHVPYIMPHVTLCIRDPWSVFAHLRKLQS